MRKILLTLSIICLLTTPCFAEVNWNDLIGKLEWKQGVAYSVDEAGFNIMSIAKIAKWKDLTLSGGYAGDKESTGHKAIANLSYSLLKLKNYVDIPILDLVEVEPGLWMGLGNINLKEMNESEFDWGVSISLISLKF